MARIEVFDPPMCCSTGVCGPAVDPKLARFAGDLDWLAGNGVAVSRATLSQEPEKFIACEPVRNALQQLGEVALPAVIVDGELKSVGRYPSRRELGNWAIPGQGRPGEPVVASGGSGGCDCGGAC